MRSLVFGGTGMLGGAVVREVRRRGGTALGLSHRQADISNQAAVDHWVETFRPEVVLNCAAMTRVDDCETEQELAFRVNGTAVGHLARAAQRAAMAVISSINSASKLSELASSLNFSMSRPSSTANSR